jgi:RND family efflux transporter MFP subunit
MRKKLIIAAAVLCILGVVAGFYFNKTQQVQAGAAMSHEFTTFLEGSGTVDAPKQTIIAPSSGLIKRISALPGQVVHAGDVILEMDDQALLLQLDEAVQALNVQKKTWIKQNETLSRTQRESAMQMSQAMGYDLGQFNTVESAASTQEIGQEQVNMARLKVEQVKEMLQSAEVKSVLDGIVLEVDAREGELVAAGTPAVLVASMDDANLLAVFADLDAASIQPGMEVELYGGCLGENKCNGVVTEIKPRAETLTTQTGTRSAAVIKVQPEDSSLFQRLGATVELRIVTGRKNAIGIPIEALAQDTAGLYVFVIRDGRAYKTDVKVGELDEYYAEILSGVRMGEVVALNPTDLHNGLKVSVK